MITNVTKVTITLQDEDKALLPLVEAFASLLQGSSKRIVKVAKQIVKSASGEDGDE